MIRGFYSQQAFQKYRPYQSSWRHFLNWLKKRKQQKKQLIYDNIEQNKYKKNPFKKRTVTRRGFGLLIKFITLLIIIMVWVALLFYLPFFYVTKINYAGLENIKEMELTTYIKENFLKPDSRLPFKNYFLINTDKIAKRMLRDFSLLSVKISKIFPDQLTIELREKKTSIIYDNGAAYFLMDEDGYLIKYLTKVTEAEFLIIKLTTSTPTSATSTLAITPATNTNTTSASSTIRRHVPDYKKINSHYGLYPIIYDKRDQIIQVGDKNIIPKNFITNILIMNQELIKQGIGVKYYVIENLGSGAQIITTNNICDIFFQPLNDLEQQLNNLKIILKDNKPKQYVDLRHGDRVYWQ